eukprot:scaffold52644_cov15-Tisochrysis_lutea.AAC.1
MACRQSICCSWHAGPGRVMAPMKWTRRGDESDEEGDPPGRARRDAPAPSPSGAAAEKGTAGGEGAARPAPVEATQVRHGCTDKQHKLVKQQKEACKFSWKLQFALSGSRFSSTQDLTCALLHSATAPKGATMSRAVAPVPLCVCVLWILVEDKKLPFGVHHDVYFLAHAYFTTERQPLECLGNLFLVARGLIDWRSLFFASECSQTGVAEAYDLDSSKGTLPFWLA